MAETIEHDTGTPPSLTNIHILYVMHAISPFTFWTLSLLAVIIGFFVRDNVRGGLSYLRWLLAYYRGQVRLAAAAYNSGEGAVDYYRGVPPYPETREYVRRVLQLFRSDRHPYDPRVVDPSAIVALRVGRN